MSFSALKEACGTTFIVTTMITAMLGFVGSIVILAIGSTFYRLNHKSSLRQFVDATCYPLSVAQGYTPLPSTYCSLSSSLGYGSGIYFTSCNWLNCCGKHVMMPCALFS